MGVILTQDEREQVKDIEAACFRCFTLINDFFSFDIEYDEFKALDRKMLTNAVWLYMQWENLSVDEAKDAVRKQNHLHEQEFLKLVEEFLSQDIKYSMGLMKYLESMYYQISGSAVWSIDCYRYKPHLATPLKSSSETAQMEIQTLKARNDDISQEGSSFFSEGSDTESDIASNLGNLEDRRPSVGSLPSSVQSDPVHVDPEYKRDNDLLDDRFLLAPYKYTIANPSKGVRDVFVDALNIWFGIPEKTLTHIKKIGQTLHTASIMLDDIEDASPLRRGQSAAHIVYGEPQTINSANYLIIWAVNDLRKLGNLKCLEIFFEEMRNSLIGQSYKFHWRQELACPSENEYLEMVDKKTGSLFRFLAQILTTLASRNQHLELDVFARTLGQYFQIRDDYKNLTDNGYTDKKGFCEDLDERKFSYLIQHAWHTECRERGRLQEIFQNREKSGMSRETKEEVLGILKTTGSFERTELKMSQLLKEIYEDVRSLEEAAGKENWSLRLLLHKLSIVE